jgi:hypothetical protein
MDYQAATLPNLKMGFGKGVAYVIIKMPDGHEEKRALVKSKTIHIQVNPLEKPGICELQRACLQLNLK